LAQQFLVKERPDLFAALERKKTMKCVDCKEMEPYKEELSCRALYQPRLSVQRDIPFSRKKDHLFTFIDLFSGIGGFRMGLQNIGGRCVFSCDINQHSKKVYERNFGEYPFDDITKIDKNIIPTHDILTAGFPCQPFSISGLKKGFEDTRGTLIYDVFEILSIKKPKIVFLENVKHLIHHDQGRTLSVISNNLEQLGYKVSYKILNAKNFGVPQNRERLIIIGHNRKKFDFSKIEYSQPTLLKEFLDKEGSFEYLDSSDFTLIDSPKKQKSGLIFCGYRNKRIRKSGVRLGTEHLSRVHKQPNRIYSTDGTHPTLPSQETAGRFWIYHEGKVRKLTISECYRIMGFPDTFIKSEVICEQYKQIGNSVCIPMVEKIGKELLQQFITCKTNE
jgi:DNA (cytosine-5)-methyltransferase 1